MGIMLRGSAMHVGFLIISLSSVDVFGADEVRTGRLTSAHCLKENHASKCIIDCCGKKVSVVIVDDSSGKLIELDVSKISSEKLKKFAGTTVDVFGRPEEGGKFRAENIKLKTYTVPSGETPRRGTGGGGHLAFSGVISDSKCGAKHGPGSENPSCVAACIRAGGSPVLITSDGKVIKITNSDAIDRRFYGVAVVISGSLSGDYLDVRNVR